MPIGSTPAQQFSSLIICEAFSSTSQGIIGLSRPRVFSRTYHCIAIKSTIVGIIVVKSMATKSVITRNATTNK
jgi:hypothetical protein